MSNRSRLPLLFLAALALCLLSWGCAQKEPEAKRKAEARAKVAGRAKTTQSGTTKVEPVLAGMSGAVPVERAAEPDSTLAAEDLLLTPEAYYYESVGRRDLFESLISEEYREANPSERPASAELSVVGILWGELDRFALVETPQGRSRVLREGDTLGDGTVVRVLPDRVIIHVTEYGGSRTVTLPLVEGGGFDESPKARRR